MGVGLLVARMDDGVSRGPLGPRPGLGALRGEARLEAAQQIVRDGSAAPVLDKLAQLARVLLETPYAQISLLTDEQVVASIQGLDLKLEERQTPLEHSLCSITVASGGPLRVSDAPQHPWVADLPPVTKGPVGSYLGVPLVTSGGLALGALCVFDRRARVWADRDVAVLTSLADTLMSELEARADAAKLVMDTARFELAVAAADIGGFEWNLATDELHWDDRLQALFGYDDGSFSGHISDFRARVHPGDTARVERAIADAVRTLGEYSCEYRIVRPRGGTRWVAARGRVVPDILGRPVRLLGAAYDSTTVRESRDQLARVMETMADAFFRLDEAWRFAYVNSEAVRVLARSRDEMLGACIWELFPEAVGSKFQSEYEHAVQTGEPTTFEAYYEPLDSWLEVRAWPSVEGLSVYFHAIDDRKAAEAEREAAITRLARIADASSQLSASLKPEEVMSTLGTLVVPTLARWVVIALRGEVAAPLLGEADGNRDPDRIRPVFVGHGDVESLQRLRGWVEQMDITMHDAHGVGAVVRTGLPEWLPQITSQTLASVVPTAVVQEMMSEGSIDSVLTVPLASRGRRLGAMAVGEPSALQGDRDTLAEIAARAAVALDNALLYGVERRSALTLQRSLLPHDRIELPDLSIATRYLPSIAGALVGGDFYQVVEVGGLVLLVLGDVEGHGMQSAARMGQLRAIVATLALEGHRPGALLARLAAETSKLLDLSLATVLVCLYDLKTRSLTYASAGHLPPLLVSRDGEPHYLDLDPGPPLGVGAATFPEHHANLPVGSTLALFSDGLVEDRRFSISDGLERLRLALKGSHGEPETTADHLLAALGREHGADDDVALLVMTHAADSCGMTGDLPPVHLVGLDEVAFTSSA